MREVGRTRREWVPFSHVARTRTPIKDANNQCKVKSCDELFRWNYNSKVHMETHEPNRNYPFTYSVPECNKKFVRKRVITKGECVRRPPANSINPVAVF